MVRIAHISDSHLGASMFQLAERRDDARKCLQKAVDMALRHDPNILVHTGDLFDGAFPHSDDLNFSMELFKDIKENNPNLHVVVIQGNHDVPYGSKYNQSPIRLLEIAGLVISTGDNGHRTVILDIDDGPKQVELHLLSWMRGGTFNRLISDFTPSIDDSLLFTHDVGKRYEEMPVHYSYIGIGHGHNFMLMEDEAIGRPGSTCIVDWKREMRGKSKLIICDIDAYNTEFQTETLNDVREFKFLTGLNVTGMAPDEINSIMRGQLDKLSLKKKGKPIVIMEVNGMIHNDVEKNVMRSDIINYGEKKLNPLFLHIEPNWEIVGARDIVLSAPLNVETSIREYIDSTNANNLDQILNQLKAIGGI
ncbi:MAG: metallophosphoesterase family protein [Candidatus Thorarchaeota archaeon]